MTPDEAASVLKLEYVRLAERHLDIDSYDDRIRTALFVSIAERERLGLRVYALGKDVDSMDCQRLLADAEARRLREALERIERRISSAHFYEIPGSLVQNALQIIREERDAALAGKAQP